VARGRGYGWRWRAPFAFYDLASSSWKTSAGSVVVDSGPSSAIWPRSGMTLRGRAYGLATLGRRTGGNGSLSLPLLKTPTSNLATNGGSQHPTKRKGGGHGPSLQDEVEHLLPTPRARDGHGGVFPLARDQHMDNLETRLVRLLPTPTSTDAKSSSGSNPAWGHGVTLTDAERATGATTPPPSSGGSDSPDRHRPPSTKKDD
jgi:hypothetical protein